MTELRSEGVRARHFTSARAILQRRPVRLDERIDGCRLTAEADSFLTDYYGGPHQATALADAIFGVTNPGGKLPFTVPRHVGQVPIHLGQKWGSGYRRTKDDIHKGSPRWCSSMPPTRRPA